MSGVHVDGRAVLAVQLVALVAGRHDTPASSAGHTAESDTFDGRAAVCQFCTGLIHKHKKDSLLGGTHQRSSLAKLAIQASTARFEFVVGFDALERASTGAGQAGTSSVGAELAGDFLLVETELLPDGTLGPDRLTGRSDGSVGTTTVTETELDVGCAVDFAGLGETAGAVIALARVGIAVRRDVGAVPVDTLTQARAVVGYAGNDRDGVGLGGPALDRALVQVGHRGVAHGRLVGGSDNVDLPSQLVLFARITNK